ncbi:hypothetical protein CBLAS_0237 [Campylobacter blaseri]|uniref:DUF177 domain-containing protein n=1 Tax=Campylobacter blaseri TaxID=2042961 RepID=A0A2P8R170_9BACT|nr:hypothetical protein [Campylobacter blaseri]PSM52243.1 hypothetical protein CQ405_04090 [Campylobacter blaseri]PSM54009.1 hypothetical protein CRN67_04090 [Campylobacter blaseri]QKF85447.1 hypothetical protein CBLAS_0237 [Campylobacter blaseri]
MNIAFSKISKEPISFELKVDNLIFKGNLKRIDSKLVNCKGVIFGTFEHICDSCGSDLNININENIALIISDGIYKDSKESLEDVMEFFDNNINIKDILHSEVEAYKSDYFYCDNCKIYKGEK